MASLARFDDLIADRSLLKHPFYVKWNRGELTLDDMRIYAKEYFQLVRRVPQIVERVRERALEQQPELVGKVECNLQEEKEHVGLWKRFAGSLGISEEELMAYEPSAGVLEAVEGLEKSSEETLEEAVATMYALERELPDIARTKKDGLSRFYGLTSEDAHVYFDEHLREAKHLHVWLTVDVSDEAGNAVERSLQNQHKVLDAVCECCGMVCV